MTDFEIIVLIVFAFSIVQSVFGIGILIFGTPTCLLLGYPFDVTISYLLPASISISSMQIFHGRNNIKLKGEFFIFTIPFIIFGLTLILINWFDFDIKIMVGVMLVLSGGIRQFPKLQHTMESFIKKQMTFYLIGMGFIHGLSNMGGAFLTIFSSSLFKEKKDIRANIACGYLIFATTQIIVLATFNPSIFHLNIIVFPFISLFTYICLGNLIFLKSNENIYQNLITVFILAYGIVLLLPI